MKQCLVMILALALLYFELTSCKENLPTIIRKPKVSFNLGPCTWIIDRQCPDSDIKFYLFTRNNAQERQLIHIDETSEKSNLSSSYFNSNHPTKIIFHGYNSDMFLHPLIEMKDEYLQVGDYNLFFIDYSNLAVAPCYFSAVHNIEHVGVCVGQLVQRLLDEGNTNIHLIGFSLGAHVTNFVSQNVGSFIIPRITGLDPAMPLFIFAADSNKLDPSDAAFVDVIHTNALIQGKIERCGHVDFYMNGGILQPGCSNGLNAIACSHHRAPDYFAESIRSYKGFWGWQCSSYINYLLGLCPPTNFLILAGEHVRPTSNGLYLIRTNDQAPFAMGKWTDNVDSENNMDIIPFKHLYPGTEELNQWGKLDGSFNNIQHFPTPFPQDPNGGNWPYFGFMGPKEIFSANINKNYENNDVIKFEKNNSNNKKISKETVKIPLDKIENNNSSNIQNINYRELFFKDYKKNLTFGIQPNNNIAISPTLQY